MKWNAWWLPVLLGSALAASYFLPKTGRVGEAAVHMEMPGSEAGWAFQAYSASKDELETLPPDTVFAKAVCLRPRPGEINSEGRLVPDRVDLSIVQSGSDLNSSIHRPERCMPAQGHSITSSSNVTLQLDKGRSFDVKRLSSEQTVRPAREGAAAMKFHCVTYYFFVGHDRITHDHNARTMIDMKDRLLLGMDQHWAYVSASTWYGKLPWIDHEITEAEADATLHKFLAGFAEKQLNWEQLGR